jgi:dihydroorotase
VKLLIKQGRVIDPASGTDKVLDILLDRKKIVAVEPKITDKTAKIIDATGKVVAPGFIDMHVHLREPGYEHKETIASGTQAAAAGGFTSVACMPNTSPINDNPGVTHTILAEARQNAVVNVFPIAAITRGSAGEELTEMANQAKAGAVAFSDDGRPVTNNQLMRRSLEYSQLLNTAIIDHCETPDLTAGGVMHEGDYSYRFGLKGIPAASEEVMVARDIILAESTGVGIHLAHISTRGSVELLRRAKAKKIPVTAEVTPHHLILDDSSLGTYDTNLKVNPPLRDKKDVQSLRKAVKAGIIDVIATDHAPHSVDEKDVEFDLAPFGINGLETCVSLILDQLVHPNILPLPRFVEMISTAPARILNLTDKGKIRPDADADLTLLDLKRKVNVNVSAFRSRSHNSPFQGWELKGAPVMTIVGGKIVYHCK